MENACDFFFKRMGKKCQLITLRHTLSHSVTLCHTPSHSVTLCHTLSHSVKTKHIQIIFLSRIRTTVFSFRSRVLMTPWPNIKQRFSLQTTSTLISIWNSLVLDCFLSVFKRKKINFLNLQKNQKERGNVLVAPSFWFLIFSNSKHQLSYGKKTRKNQLGSRGVD